MVLRDARMYALLDDRYHRNIGARSVSRHYTLPIVLQLQSCIR